MASTLHPVVTYYGVQIKIPLGVNYRKFVDKAYKLRSLLDSDKYNVENYKMVSLMPYINLHMDKKDMEEYDNMAVLIIGFIPTNFLEDLDKCQESLEDYVHDNPIFEGYHFKRYGKFFSGIVWDKEHIWNDIDSHTDTDTDTDTRSYTYSVSESDWVDSDSDSD